MKLKLITAIAIFPLLLSCGSLFKCPREDIYLQGSLNCNGEFRHIFTEIKAGELDTPTNYISVEQWKKVKENIVFDKQNTEEKKEEGKNE